MDKISEDLVQRMAACIQAYATGDDDLRGSIIQATGRTIHAEFVAIAAELPKPVDPDLIEARKICKNSPAFWVTSPGAEDDPLCALGLVVAAIKRGRELAGGAS